MIELRSPWLVTVGEKRGAVLVLLDANQVLVHDKDGRMESIPRHQVRVRKVLFAGSTPASVAKETMEWLAGDA